MNNYLTKARVETFSDGVFAIIITLLVLELKVPHLEPSSTVDTVSHALIELLPKFVAWVISFMIVGVIWVNHHRLFESIRNVDHGLFWLNANLLLWTSFIPFPTALLGDLVDNKLAASFFGIASSLMGFAFVFLRIHMWRKPELTIGMSESELRAAIKTSFYFGPALYLFGAAAAWLSPYLAIAIYAITPMYFIVPRPFARKSDGIELDPNS